MKENSQGQMGKQACIDVTVIVPPCLSRVVKGIWESLLNVMF
jgi:hypothetical protein